MAPGRPPATTGSAKENSSDQKTPNLNISVNEQGTNFRSHITASLEEPDTGCGPDGWGIPISPTGVAPHITALIATVPDPIHSSLAIEFDRSIDVLMQAAAENNYVGSYFWLPWKHRLDTVKSVQSASDTEGKEDLDREKQPGLIILKQSDSIPELPPRSPNDRVIYLFLVGQTPAVGVNGEQLQRAIRAEVDLQKNSPLNIRTAKPTSSGPTTLARPPPSEPGSTAPRSRAKSNPSRWPGSLPPTPPRGR
jgi:hypothetical protein